MDRSIYCSIIAAADGNKTNDKEKSDAGVIC